jgi:hypothetical protein
MLLSVVATRQLGFWISLVLVLILLPPVILMLFIISDRKHQFHLAKLRERFVWDGLCSSSIATEVKGNKVEVLDLLRQVLTVVGDGEVTLLDSNTLIAWTSFSLMLPALQQQLAFHIQSQSDGGFLVCCCARPRFATTLVDYGRSEKLVTKLVERVSTC